MTDDQTLEHVDQVLRGTLLEGAPLMIRDDGYLQIGFPDVDELATPGGWLGGGLGALLEEAADSRFGGIAGLSRGAFVVTNPLDATITWQWSLVFDAFSNRASTLLDLPREPPAFPW